MAKKSNIIILVFVLILIIAVGVIIYLRIAQNHKPDENAIYYKNLSDRRVVEIELLNGCGKGQIVIQLLKMFREKGFDVKKTGNADNFNYNETLIIDRTQKGNFAGSVKELLKLGKIEADTSGRYSPVDITVVIGKDYITENK